MGALGTWWRGARGRLGARLLRSAVENPSQSFGSDEFWAELFGGRASKTGLRVGAREALTDSAMWRACNLISGYVAKTPLHIYVRLAEGGKERATSHPAYRLLRRRSCRELKAFDFKRTLMAHVLLAGNGYAWIRRAGDGRPLELWPLSPYRTYPVRQNGELWIVTNVDGQGVETGQLRKLRPEDVLHVRGFGHDPLVGCDVVSFGREVLGMSLAAREYGAEFFAGHAVPGVVIKRPLEAPQLSDAALKNLEESWDRMVTGMGKHHRTVVLREGMEPFVIGVDARKAQLLEMRKFCVRDVANLTGVPPHKLGDDSRTAYASLEQENQSFLDDCLDVWFSQIEDECAEKLLTEREKAENTHVVEFLRQSLVRADMTTRYEAYNKGLQAGFLTRDEVRERENLNPLPDGDGSRFFVPLNMTLAGGPDSDEREDLAFKREVVKKLLEDATIGDVVFNLIEGTTLLHEVNIPVYPNVEEPWLPVVVEGGRQSDVYVATGEELTNSAGDIVGGGLAPAPAPADERGQAEPEESTDPQDAESLDPAIDLADAAAVERAFGKIVRDLRRRKAQARRAHRALLTATLRRAQRRLAGAAARAAQKPQRFVTWLDEDLPRDHRQVIADMLAPVCETLASVGTLRANPGDLADAYLGGIRAALLHEAECQPDELDCRVDAWASRGHRTLPEGFVEWVFGNAETQRAARKEG